MSSPRKTRLSAVSRSPFLTRQREQFRRVCRARLRAFQPRKHSNELANTVFPINHLDTRGSYGPTRPLGHNNMLIGKCSDLRQVRDHDDLRLTGQTRQPSTHFNGDFAANSGVDFVKHKRGDAVAVGKDHLNGQHDSGQLTTRGATPQRPEIATRMGAQQKRDGIGAVGAWFTRHNIYAQVSVRHGQGMEFFGDRSGKFLGSHLASTSDRGCLNLDGNKESSHLSLQDIESVRIRRLNSTLGFLPPLEYIRESRAVGALES